MPRVHKYVKRTGAPGSYRYWYKMPDGTLKAAETGTDEHRKAQIDHVKRLLAGMGSHHDMSKDDIARETGRSREQVSHDSDNMRQRVRAGKAAHDYHEGHIQEAALIPGGPNYETHATRMHGKAESHGLPRASGTRPRAAARAAPAAAPAAPAVPEAAAPTPAAAPARPRRPRTPQVAAVPGSTPLGIAPTPAAAPAPAPTPIAGVHPSDPISGSLQAIHDAGYPDKLLNEMMEGIKVTTPGESEGEKVGAITRYRPESRGEILDHIKENARKGIFTTGFKYLDAGTEGQNYEQALAPFGFTKVSETAGEHGRTKVVLKGPEGMIFTASSTSGGYSNLTGPTQATHRMMKRILESASYVKDVSPYFDGLHGQPTDEEYAAAQGTAPAAPAAAGAPAVPPGFNAEAFGRLSPEAQAAALAAHERMKARGHAATGGPAPAAPAAPAPERTPEESAARARAATAKTIGPASPAAAAAEEAAPGFAGDDRAISEMLASQAAGGNPYLDRAKKYFTAIHAELRSSNKKRFDGANNFLSSVMTAHRRGITDKAGIKKIYEEEFRNMNTTDGEMFSKAQAHFEAASFMDFDEILKNKPIDIEAERMKHGYPAKQFARLREHIKPEWHAANPNGYPPMPTWGDLKTWPAGGKPAWAGNTRTSVPKEVFDAAVKGPDGKPQYPPADLPIHLMPAWNYIVKSSAHQNAELFQRTSGKMRAELGREPTESEVKAHPSYTANEKKPYQTTRPIVQGRVEAGIQAPRGENPQGYFANALRRYVQMRGGADQLVDIPHHKLAALGLTHHDIFKGDDQLNQILRTKIIDPVALINFIMDKGHTFGAEKEIKKSERSFALVITEQGAIDFNKSFVLDPRIDAIKAELERRSRYVTRS
jgi:hypothetical protein